MDCEELGAERQEIAMHFKGLSRKRGTMRVWQGSCSSEGSGGARQYFSSSSIAPNRTRVLSNDARGCGLFFIKGWESGLKDT